MKRLFPVLCLVLGCGESAAPPLVSLSTPVVVSADGPSLRGELRFHIAGGVGWQESDLKVALTRAEVRLRSDGNRAWLDWLALPLDDLVVAPGALPPTGLTLRELGLGVGDATRSQIVAVNPDTLMMTTKVPLSLAWKMELPDGALHPLGPMITPELNVSTTVVRPPRDLQHVEISVEAKCAGECWSIPGIVSLRDAAFEVTVEGEARPNM